MAASLNVPTPTLGGMQLWTDHRVRAGYRVQRNRLTDHWRLLDSNDVRQAWGSREDVLHEYEAAVAGSTSSCDMIVLLHGLIRTDRSMKSMQKALQEQCTGDVIRFGYASTQQTLADSARALREVLDDYGPETHFRFVGHSMGNIVVRHLVGDLQAAAEGESMADEIVYGSATKVRAAAKDLLSRCDAMVMLGPPNQGASIARRLAKTGLFETVVGPGAMQLGPRWEEIEPNLATPPFPFAIVAGNFGDSIIANPLTDGPGDLVVSIDEAKLDGADVIHEVPIAHSILMDRDDVQRWTADWFNEQASRNHVHDD
ncbi:MAG: lipase [Planctomycetota bacterium]